MERFLWRRRFLHPLWWSLKAVTLLWSRNTNLVEEARINANDPLGHEALLCLPTLNHREQPVCTQKAKLKLTQLCRCGNKCCN